MRLPGNGGTAASDQKIEIRALVGLGHALDVQLLIPALHRRCRLPPLRTPGLQFFLRHIEMELPCFHIHLNHVAVPHQRERSANRGFRSDVQDHRAISGSAHASVRDADHVFEPAFEYFGWQTHIADLRHARIAARSTVLEHKNRIFVHHQIRVLDAFVIVLNIFEGHGRAAMAQQMRRCRRRLDYRAVRREIAPQYCDPTVFRQRIVHRPNDFAIPVGSVLRVFPDGLSVYGKRVTMQQTVLAQKANDSGKPAGVVEIFHQKASRGHQVDDSFDLAAQFVPIASGKA